MKCRPSWDSIWMGLARKISERSTCNTPDRNVGCVIVSEDNSRVLANGYNGSAKGDNNSCAYSPDGGIKIGSSRCSCVHAEMNAIAKLDTTDPCRKVMYLTLSPCILCYQLIVNVGIDKLIVDKIYSSEILDELCKLGVEVEYYADH